MSLILIIISALALFLITGLTLLTLGLKGKRKGNNPHCRKCNYNLSGITPPSPTPFNNIPTNAQGSRSLGQQSNSQQQPQQTNCPECRHPLIDSTGNPTHRTGRRRKRPAFIAVGLLLLAITIAGTTIAINQQLKQVNSWLELAPNSIVIIAAERNITGAAGELVIRLPAQPHATTTPTRLPRYQPLAPDEIARTIDAVTAAQRRATGPWPNEWAILAAALLHHEDHWSDEQLAEFVRNSINVSIIAQPRVHADTPFSVVILLDASQTVPLRPYSHDYTRFSIMTRGLDLYTDEPPQHNNQYRGSSNHWMLYKDMQIRISKTITTEQLGIGPAPGQYQAHARTPVQVARMNQGSFRSTDNWPTAIDIDLPFTINIVDPSESIVELRTIDQCPTLMRSLRAISIHISGSNNSYEILTIPITTLPHSQPLEASLVGRLELLIDGQRIPFDNNFATRNDEHPSTTVRWHHATTQALLNINPTTGQRETNDTHNQLDRIIRRIYSLYTPEQLRFRAQQHSPNRLLLEQYQTPSTDNLPTHFDIIYTPDPTLAPRLAPSAPAILNQPLIFKNVPLHTNYMPRDPSAAISPQPLNP